MRLFAGYEFPKQKGGQHMKSDKRKQQYKQLGLAVAYYRKMHGLHSFSWQRNAISAVPTSAIWKLRICPLAFLWKPFLTSLMYWKFPSNVSLIFRMPPANRSVFKSPRSGTGDFLFPHILTIFLTIWTRAPSDDMIEPIGGECL